ncbi:C39 family peptidase [Nocardia wallacei]|uniref:C39 family peptidase n=1 Tax=Nocardia wallacei TaxID=480035 RepID=UPI002458FB1B|nr:C39 family peptidase [Nocardia wallacei]
MEKVLPYNRGIVPQETGWWCGPATTQVILDARGIHCAERDLASQLEALEGNVGWDDQDGTDRINQVATVLNRYLGGGYVVRQMPTDPPTREQIDLLWSDIVASIDAGFGVAANIDAPMSNYPRGVKGSASPRYGGGRVFHYFAILGYDDVERAVWIADSGFPPFGYWMAFGQLATLIPPKGYAAAPAADRDTWRDNLLQLLGPGGAR